MEEEKKVSEQEKVEQEQKTEALLEPRPYKRKAEPEDTATDSKDTSSEEEATPVEERPVNAEEKVFKKRYDDLKRHYDSTVNKHKEETSNLKRQLEESTQQVLPKSKEEIEAWRTKYPDVYDVITTIADTKADEKAKQVQTKLKDLELAQQNVKREKAEVELSKLHPDFNDIRADEKFHEWVEKQDSTIQGWLYDNSSNATLAGRAIDLYKLDAGITKPKKASIDKKEASKSVTSTSKKDIEAGDKKIWSASEIAKLKPHEFLKHEKDIDLARVEGRIRN
tara:strand:+ start:796 stop:1635 length:840 start_codon:yes stop_codon:yes gene_type:complete